MSIADDDLNGQDSTETDPIIPDFNENDLAILKLIQKDSQEPLSGTDVAKKIGISTSAVTDRLRRFRAQGIITNWSARLHAEKIGIQAIAFVAVTLRDQKENRIEMFSNFFRTEDFPEVLECYLVTGDFDFLLKVAAVDMRSFKQFITKRLPSIGLTVKTHTMIVLDEVRFHTELPLSGVKRVKRRPRSGEKEAE